MQTFLWFTVFLLVVVESSNGAKIQEIRETIAALFEGYSGGADFGRRGELHGEFSGQQAVRDSLHRRGDYRGVKGEKGVKGGSSRPSTGDTKVQAEQLRHLPTGGQAVRDSRDVKGGQGVKGEKGVKGGHVHRRPSRGDTKVQAELRGQAVRDTRDGQGVKGEKGVKGGKPRLSNGDIRVQAELRDSLHRWAPPLGTPAQDALQRRAPPQGKMEKTVRGPPGLNVERFLVNYLHHRDNPGPAGQRSLDNLGSFVNRRPPPGK